MINYDVLYHQLPIFFLIFSQKWVNELIFQLHFVRESYIIISTRTLWFNCTTVFNCDFDNINR